MNKVQQLRDQAEIKFGQDPNEAAISSRALDFLEQWTSLSGCDGSSLGVIATLKRKRECAAFIKARLYKAREEEYGFLGALLSAVVFQILITLIVKWIMDKFFN